MASLAAILVLVVCPSPASACDANPIRIVSYDSRVQCERAISGEIGKASNLPGKVMGSCVAVDRKFLAGRPRIDFASTALKQSRKLRVAAIPPVAKPTGYASE